MENFIKEGKEKMIDTLLFPSSVFDKLQVDEDLKAEYDAALSTGLFKIILFSYEDWFHNGRIVIRNIPADMKPAIYRGWMMKPKQYENFYYGLREHNIKLVTEPEQYKLMHIFPNVYEYVKEDTAKMEVYPLHTQIDVEDLKKRFVRFMVKDFVKSVKGTEFPRYFDRSITQEEFDRWMEVFYKYRGGLLTGGICIKEFLDFKRYGDRTNEYRVFYANHEITTISRNSAQGIYAPLPPQDLIEKYRNLGSIYYTVDYAELEDGRWKVVEAGDGGVSGLSEFQDYEQYYRALYHSFN